MKIIKIKYVYKVYALKNGRVQFLHNEYSSENAKAAKVRLKNLGAKKVTFKKRRIN